MNRIERENETIEKNIVSRVDTPKIDERKIMHVSIRLKVEYFIFSLN